jgi:ABC-type transporter Mla subunit MlaD
VFLVWESPASGFLKVTDSFLFDDAGKIIRQNIVVETETAEPTTAAVMSTTGATEIAPSVADLVDKLDGLDGKLTGLIDVEVKGKVDAVGSKVDVLSNNVEGLTQHFEDLSDAVTGVDTKVAELGQDLTDTMVHRFGLLSDQVGDVKGELDTKINALDGKFNNLAGMVGGLNSKVDILTEQLASALEALTTIAANSNPTTVPPVTTTPAPLSLFEVKEGHRGNIREKIATYKGSTPEACAELCVAETQCKAFAIATWKLCYLFNTADKPVPHGKFTFYSKM